jgi:hypothetical protein
VVAGEFGVAPFSGAGAERGETETLSAFLRPSIKTPNQDVRAVI